jgi:hypothetical protein
MPKIKHPAFDDVFQDVTDAGPWVEQGWELAEEGDTPPPVEPAPELPTVVTEPVATVTPSRTSRA